MSIVRRKIFPVLMSVEPRITLVKIPVGVENYNLEILDEMPNAEYN